MKRIKLWKKRREIDNKGMAMVLVIVAIALVTLLTTVLMSVSMLNYQMKVTEQKSTVNFYSAEAVLDQIHVGLQQEVSDATEAAYMQAMKQNSLTPETEDQRINKFNKTYTDALLQTLKNGEDTNNYLIGGEKDDVTGLYLTGLASYLDQELVQRMEEGKLEIKCNQTAGQPSMKAMTDNKGVVLYALVVEYTDDEGFYSVIQTDILLNVPDISLKKASSLPNAFDYSIIANENLKIEASGGSSILDSVYAGNGELDAGTNEYDGIGLLVKNSGTIEFSDIKNLVVKSDIKVERSDLVLDCDNIFANGVEVASGMNTLGGDSHSAQLTVDGDMYVADDMTINDWNVTVDLNGRYFGYCGAKDMNPSVDTVVEKQSAIVLNGGNTKLDLNNLEELVLCGNAFLNENESVDAYDGSIMMGTSLAAKTDQIAFLAPTVSIGTAYGVAQIGKNPMSLAEANKWADDANKGNIKAFDSSVYIPALGKALSDYNLTDNDYRVVVKNINGENITYVYLYFENVADANAYYRDYVNAAESQMRTYLNKYKNSIVVSDTKLQDLSSMSKIRSMGNIVTYNLNNANCSLYMNDTVTKADGNLDTDKIIAMQEIQDKYTDTSHAMCSMLNMDLTQLTEAEKAQDIYHNLVNTAALDFNGTRVYEADGKQAIIVGKQGNVPEITVGDYTHAQYPKCALIVTPGDVKIEGNFSGTIIAGGTVSLTDRKNTVISADKQTVTSLLKTQVTETAEKKSVIATYFVNGDAYDLSSVGTANTSYVDLGSVITYQNWTKN